MKSRRLRGACRQGHYHFIPNTNLSPQPVTDASEQLKVTAIRKTARHEKPQPKSTSAPKPAAGKPKKKAAASFRTAAAKLTTPNLVVPTQESTSPIEEISDLLDHLHFHACVELTLWLLTSISSLPTGQPAHGLCQRPFSCLWRNMAARPRRTERAKPLRLACWNADEVRGRKLELEHFFNQHSVDICPLSETFLNHGQAFRHANYVCHLTDRLTAGGGTAILVRRGRVHHSVPVPGLNHLKATAIQVALASKPVKILAAYLSPSRPLIGKDLSACFGGGFLVLIAGDLHTKHVEWKSRLSKDRGNTCVIMPTRTRV